MHHAIKSIFAELRQSMRLSLPLIASQLIYGTSGFIITVMIAHLGKDELATNAIVWSIFITLILFFIGILSATGVLVSQSFGANDIKGVKTSMNQGVILAFLFSIPMMLTAWIMPQILYWIGQNPIIVDLATPYFHSLIWCMLPLNLIVVLEQFLAGIALTRLLFFMSLVEVPLEILFFYALIFGKFGMAKYGLSGIGYGIAMAVSLLIIIFGLYIHFGQKFRKYAIFSQIWRFNKKYFTEILRVGLPLGGMYCIEVALLAMVAFMMERFGNDALAAHQITYQCFVFSLTIIFGISHGTTIRVGHEVGRNDKEALKLAAYVNMGIGFCFMFSIANLFIWFPKYVISLDIDITLSKYQTLVNHATAFLSIAGLLQLSDSIRNITMGALRGLKDTHWPMYISFIVFWLIAFPVAYLLAFTFNFGGIGIWWGLVIGLSGGAIILLLRFNRLIKRVDLVKLITKSETV